MPWNHVSVIEVRWRFIQALLKGQQSLAKVCRCFGISRKTAYKWRERFTNGGRRGLGDQRRRPTRSPRELSIQWRKRICALRRKKSSWGAKKIYQFFIKSFSDVPGERTVSRVLKAGNFTKPKRRRALRACVVERTALSQAKRANHVWTVDFKGWFRIGNGQRVDPLTVRDLFSRKVLAIQMLPDQKWKPVRAVFIGVFRKNGLPCIIRVDNGSPFASTGPAGLSRLSAWWVSLGIRVEFSRPGCPQDNGGHEQFHRVYKKENTQPPTHSWRGQQSRTTRWIKCFNHVRPHQALGGKVPAEKYKRSLVRFDGKEQEWIYPAKWQTRRVRSNGEIRWQGRTRFIGEAFVGHILGLNAKGEGIWHVQFRSLLIGHLYNHDVGAMRPAVYQHKSHIVSKS